MYATHRRGMIPFLVLVAAMVIFVIALTQTGVIKASSTHARIAAVGNGGACDLSSRQSFKIEGSGWENNRQLVVSVFPPGIGAKAGELYPYLSSGLHRPQTNSRGNFKSKDVWTCWPTAQLNFPDKTGTYYVFAYQPGTNPPKEAHTYFTITK